MYQRARPLVLKQRVFHITLQIDTGEEYYLDIPLSSSGVNSTSRGIWMMIGSQTYPPRSPWLLSHRSWWITRQKFRDIFEAYNQISMFPTIVDVLGRTTKGGLKDRHELGSVAKFLHFDIKNFNLGLDDHICSSARWKRSGCID